MRTFISIFLVIISIVGWIVFIVPTYRDGATVRKENADYEAVLENSRKLDEARSSLLKKYQSFNKSDIDRLAVMVPESPDNVKLILELDNLASRSGLALQNAKVADDIKTVAPAGSQVSNDPYEKLRLEFTLVGTYNNFTQFMKSMEGSLRLIDINKVSFVASDDKQNYQFTVGVTTYWLK
jgi:Tfp pilus assembly protein PilO